MAIHRKAFQFENIMKCWEKNEIIGVDEDEQGSHHLQ